LAKNWAVFGKEFSDQFYCQNSGIFQARLVKMEALMLKDKSAKNLYSLLTSMAGEMGNNSYDHNLGQWPDTPGIFFGYDLGKKQIILADRGIGILETLKRVRPELKNHEEALKMAFTEIISGREPEARGNGLKYVRKVVSEINKLTPLTLYFQSGSAVLNLKYGDLALDISESDFLFHGCLALISF